LIPSANPAAIAWYLSYVDINHRASHARGAIVPLREAAMYASVRERHTPDPKCCFCGLRPRSRGNDALRLMIVVLLLLPLVLIFLG
jgi:hypothetical protein